MGEEPPERELGHDQLVECAEAGNTPNEGASRNSRENDKQIEAAIAEARQGLDDLGFKTSLSRDSRYQLSNRAAFTWKLASLGIPTVLVYLGFLGDSGVENVSQPFANDLSWGECFWNQATGIVPKELFEQRVNVGAAPAWFLLRSRQVLEISPGPG